MVRALHEADIEVILDVVYNHTAEGNHLGPTLCFRGIDNAAYYRLVDGDQRALLRHHGHREQPAHAAPARAPADHGLAALLGDRDARRRFPVRPRRDAGPAVPRGRPAVARSSTSSSRTRWSRQVKLIAEPWDVGEGGYQVGNFPPLWTEWNGKYRDTVRDFWRGEPRTLGEFASRLTGSSDLYQDDGRHAHRVASTSSPPTTASRCATWSPTTTSTTRPTARAATTARATTGPGTAASRATPTTRPSSRCAPGSSATSSPRCCCPRACR